MKKINLISALFSVLGLCSPLSAVASHVWKLNFERLSIQSDRFQGECESHVLKNDEQNNDPSSISYSYVLLQKTLSNSEKNHCSIKPNFNFIKVELDIDTYSGTLKIAEGREVIYNDLFPDYRMTHQDSKKWEMVGYYSDSISLQPIDVTAYTKGTYMFAKGEDIRDIPFSCITASEREIDGGFFSPSLTEKLLFCKSAEKGTKLSFSLRLKVKSK